VDAQLGLEATPDEYVANMVAVFREVRRVLTDDGTLWLNLGDSYAGSWGNSGRRPELDEGAGGQRDKNVDYLPRGGWDERRERPPGSHNLPGLKPKDMVGIPWRVAFALQADGWWLRSDIIWAKPNPMPEDIIWAKPNPMPESVTDRPTKAHEYVFLLSKSARYYYDHEAVAETSTGQDAGNGFDRPHRLKHGNGNPATWLAADNMTRNARTVWTIATKPYPEAHFATFPPELPSRCIKAGSAPGDTVLDPFGGSGTTAATAVGLGRKAIHIDLNPEYLELARQRIGPMLCEDAA
jgi:DNA modification methylase